MDAATKKKIDDIWLNSYEGAWCKAVAKDDEAAAEKALQDEYDAGYDFSEMLARELADKMTKYLKNMDDLDDYLRLLDAEDPDLVEVFIVRSCLYDVLFDRLYGK